MPNILYIYYRIRVAEPAPPPPLEENISSAFSIDFPITETLDALFEAAQAHHPTDAITSEYSHAF